MKERLLSMLKSFCSYIEDPVGQNRFFGNLYLLSIIVFCLLDSWPGVVIGLFFVFINAIEYHALYTARESSRVIAVVLPEPLPIVSTDFTYADKENEE